MAGGIPRAVRLIASRAGALVMGFGNQSRAPPGGIWVVGLISKPVLHILAMAGRKEAADIEPAASRQATATG